MRYKLLDIFLLTYVFIVVYYYISLGNYFHYSVALFICMCYDIVFNTTSWNFYD